jgi:hypothetical protein
LSQIWIDNVSTFQDMPTGTQGQGLGFTIRAPTRPEAFYATNFTAVYRGWKQHQDHINPSAGDSVFDGF